MTSAHSGEAMLDVIVIGAGLVGLATAMALLAATASLVIGRDIAARAIASFAL